MLVRSRMCTQMYSLVLATLLATDAVNAVAAEKHQFNVSTASPAAAIHEFGEQSGVQILAAGEKINGKHFNTVEGEHSVDEGLRLLLAGSGLTHRYVGDRAVALVAAQDGGGGRANATDATGPSTTESTLRSNVVQLDEVVVVGSYIRGLDRPVGAEVLTFDRDDIDKTGFATTQEVLRTLPQVFGGGVSDDTTTAGLTRDVSTNINRGNAINLRGLGSTSTLVLLNGRRIAPGGFEGVFTDVTNIPLSAVERIEVLPDGASALYGSDAVGGVVNFKLRKDYSGAETQGRIGSVTDGDSKEYQVGQIVGKGWDSGNVLLSLEYYNHDRLRSTDRDETNSDLRAQGGNNFNYTSCNPGTITSGGTTYAIPANQNGTALTAGSFTAATSNLCNRNADTDLLPDSSRKSGLLTVQQEIGDRVKLYADALYTERDVDFNITSVGPVTVTSANAFYVNPMGGTAPETVAYNFTKDFGPTNLDGKVTNSTFTLGGNVAVGGDWQIGTYVTRSKQSEDRSQLLINQSTVFNNALLDSNRATAFNPFGDGSNTNPATLQAIRNAAPLQTRAVDLELRLASLRADGPVFSLPAGDVKVAVGGEYREDSLDSALNSVSSGTFAPTTTVQNLDRNVTAGYMELFVPIVSEQNSFTGVQRLELTGAGRHEDYSDFGGSTVPRAGITWWPVKSFSVKGTWSKSYRAPSLVDLNDGGNGSQLLTVNDPTVNANRSVLFYGTKNSQLQEETADIWTAGVQFAPLSVPRLSVGATYFDIDFNNRIDTFPGGATAVLNNPQAAFAVNRNFTADQRAAVCAANPFLGTGNCLTSAIVAIVDGRLNNTSQVKTNGVDLLGTYGLDTGVGSFDFGANATYLFKYSRRPTSTSALVDLVDTAGNPPNLRGRVSLAWRRGSFGSTLFVNYTDDYKDNISINPPNRKIDSWTTLDLNLSYSFERLSSPALKGTQVFLSAQNLLDEDAPFYNNAAGIGYDTENADIVGRRVSLFLRKEW
jgi:iron complex outermembrane receptor protein